VSVNGGLALYVPWMDWRPIQVYPAFTQCQLGSAPAPSDLNEDKWNVPIVRFLTELINRNYILEKVFIEESFKNVLEHRVKVVFTLSTS